MRIIAVTVMAMSVWTLSLVGVAISLSVCGGFVRLRAYRSLLWGGTLMFIITALGHRTGRAAAADFFRKIRVLTEPVKFEVEDILASEGRAAIVGELATRIKSSGKVCTSQFAIILTISGDAITRFQMLEDSFGLSKAVHS